MARILYTLGLAVASAQDLFLAPSVGMQLRNTTEPRSPSASPSPTSSKMPCLPMKNAAKPGMCYPIMGLATKGIGYKLGLKEECWYYPQCCTQDHCPIVNAPRDWLKLASAAGGARVDFGWPYGGWPGDDPAGVGKGIKESGIDRKDIFATIKVGYAGPMGKEDSQVDNVLNKSGLDYADLCLVHLPEVGPGTGSHGEYGPAHCVPGSSHANKDPYNARLCRLSTWKSLLSMQKAGKKCRAVGVTDWNVTNLKELEDAGVELPSVVQYKFHLHQSTANSIQSDLVKYCKEKGIVLNGIAPLGIPDWITFNDPGMTPTTLQEPKVQAIAKKVGKTPAQVMLRWIVQQGIATHSRTMSVDHMKENLDIFSWSLGDKDMETLSSMPQCHTQRGAPYMKGDTKNLGGHGNPNDHGNVVGITEHC